MNLLEAVKSSPETVASFFAKHIDFGRGLRVGESTVVSRFAHQVSAGRRGKVLILTDKGTGQYLHLDVFHGPGEVSGADQTLRELLRAMFLSEYPDQPVPDIIVDTTPTRVQIHISLDPRQYSAIPLVALVVEDYLTQNGLELRKVDKISHTQAASAGSSSQPQLAGTALTWLPERRFFTGLASELGSVESAMELLEAIDPRSQSRRNLAELSAKHGGFSVLLNKLIAEGAVKRTLWGGYQLTSKGKELMDYAQVHARELEAEFRQIIRRTRVNSAFEQIAFQHRSSANFEVSERGRVIRLGPGEWAGNIAVAETAVAAKTAGFFRGTHGFYIDRGDIHVHRRLRKNPQDILLLIDASTSMRGRRFRAAVRLAEYLVLATRERIGVIIFHHRVAQAASGFTRNYNLIKKGLRHVHAGGLTPLATGIMASAKLIKTSRTKNPLVILITDGLPTIPCESSDPVQDALEAANVLSEIKARLVVIGLKPDAEFLHRLADAAQGSAYIVDDLQHESLITIVRHERSDM